MISSQASGGRRASRRVSTQMFSLDFSDTMRPQNVDESAVAQSSGSGGTEALEAIAAVLQLFDLCRPAEDTTIAATDLAKVLRTHLGGDTEVERILGLLNGDGNLKRQERYTFLTYWQGMDRFFNESGAFHQAAATTGDREVLGTIKGMQKFRDGVLNIARTNGLLQEGTISSLDLLDLLHDIRSRASDPAYWDEVMQAVPAEEGFGLTVTEVAEAVCIWLKDYLKAEMDTVGEVAITEAADNGGKLHTRDSVADESTTYSRTSREEGGEALLLAQSALSVGSRRDSFRRHSLVAGGDAIVGRDAEQRAQEILDLISDRTPEENEMVHQALSSLCVLHESIFQALSGHQNEALNFQSQLSTMSERKDHLEEEVARSVHHAQELDVRFGEVERERDECAQKVSGLEKQVLDLSCRCSDLQDQLAKSLEQAELHQQDLQNGQRTTLHIKDRMAQLEQDTDNAEGRAQWLRSKLERLQTRFKVANRTARSYASCAEEGEEAAFLLQEQLLSGKPLAQAEGAPDLAKQLEMQQTQLTRLRQVRDDLLKAHDSWAARGPDDGSVSPRELQVQRRCAFLAAELQALLQHARELESLLDNCDNGNVDIEAKRALSVQRIADESKKNFAEFSEKLHTLEVQKADVDQELRKLQQRCAEQENQLRSVQRDRDQLIVEAGTSKDYPDKKLDESDGSSSISGAPSRQMQAGFLFDGTKPARGELRSSPKAPQGKDNFQKGVRTMIHMQHLAGRGQSPNNRPMFQMSARPSIEYIESGQWTREDGKDRHKSRSGHRSSHSKVDKDARREQKDKETKRQKDDDGKDRHRSRKRGGRGDGNCETQ